MGNIAHAAKPAISALVQMMKAERPYNNFVAAEALVLVGADPKTVVPFLIDFLKKTDSPLYRQRIPELLGECTGRGLRAEYRL